MICNCLPMTPLRHVHTTEVRHVLMACLPASREASSEISLVKNRKPFVHCCVHAGAALFVQARMAIATCAYVHRSWSRAVISTGATDGLVAGRFGDRGSVQFRRSNRR